MTSWLIAVAWVTSGVATWGDYEIWYERRFPENVAEERRLNSTISRDIGRLALMLFGPIVFIAALLNPEKRSK